MCEQNDWAAKYQLSDRDSSCRRCHSRKKKVRAEMLTKPTLDALIPRRTEEHQQEKHVWDNNDFTIN